MAYFLILCKERIVSNWYFYCDIIFTIITKICREKKIISAKLFNLFILTMNIKIVLVLHGMHGMV